MMKANVISFPDFQSNQPKIIRLDSANRRRLMRYRMKKTSLEVNPRTVFNLEFIRNV